MKGTVIISGAGKGIGLELCKWFSKQDYRTIGISRNIGALKKIHNVIAVQADLNQLNDLFFKLDSVLQDIIPGQNYLIHNAGLLINEPFESLTSDQILEMTSVNFTSPLLLTQRLLPWLNQPEGSHIIYVGSMGGFQGSVRYPGLSVYSASKSAFASLTESLAYEYHNTAMRFNTLALGAVDTDMLRSALPKYKAEVTPEQIANFIGTFALQAYPFINGKVIPLAGMNPEF